jgi:hypothetical protein
MVLGTTAVFGDPLEVVDLGRLDLGLLLIDLLVREQSGFDPLGEIDLLLSIE